MRTRLVAVLSATLWLSTTAFGKDPAEDARCRNVGALILGSWHRVDLCLEHGKLDRQAALQARQRIAEAYPKLSQEIQAGGQLSSAMKEVARALPYDLDDAANAELLTGMCETSLGAMRRYVEPDWKKVLPCWQ